MSIDCHFSLTPEEYAGLERAMQWPEDLASYDLAHQTSTQEKPDKSAKLKTKPSKRPRDSQRSKVYAWERFAVAQIGGLAFNVAEFDSLAECEAFALPIWNKERSRFGLAAVAVPAIVRPSRGQRRALAHFDHRISLPKWSRSRWVILHELAHRLNSGTDATREAHGPRFVGILMSLVSRWLGYDAGELMALADETGVKYSSRRN